MFFLGLISVAVSFITACRSFKIVPREEALTEAASLSDRISYYLPAADMIVEDGHFVGVAVYVGKNTDRYGYYGTIPITADPYYGLAPNLIRPSDGEVVHGFCLLYTDGRIVGDNHGHYTSWEDRSIEYYDFRYTLVRADELRGEN